MQKEKKKILVLTSRYPYPVVGGERLRIHEICKELSKHFEITLLALCDDKQVIQIPQEETAIYKKIRKVYLSKWRSYVNTAIGLFCKKPLQISYYKSQKFELEYNKLIAENDIVFVHLIRCAEYALKSTKPKFLEMTDAISLNYQRIKNKETKKRGLKEWIFSYECDRLLKYEREIYKKFNATFFVSDVDRRFLSPSSDERLVVSKNGVDLSRFEYKDTRSGTNLVFIGNMLSIQNLDAVEYLCNEILPELNQLYPNLCAKIIGRIAESDKCRLEKLHNVIVTGEVASINDEIENSVVGVCSVRLGAGIQNKILEYMALGLPVVTTKIGYEGLSAIVGKEIFVGETTNDIVQKIKVLLSSEVVRRNMAQEARKYLVRCHSWSSNLRAIVEKIQSYE